MEAASENRRRGRPAVLSDIDKQFYSCVSPDNKTTRGLQNVKYRSLALGYLMDDPAYSWLCDKEKMGIGAPNAWKPGILAELGRFLDEETIRAFAARICELKPKTKDAVIILRRARLGRAATPNYLTLVTSLCRAVDGYKATRPDCETAIILRALEDVAEIVRGQERGQD